MTHKMNHHGLHGVREHRGGKPNGLGFKYYAAQGISRHQKFLTVLNSANLFLKRVGPHLNILGAPWLKSPEIPYYLSHQFAFWFDRVASHHIFIK
jgi:hypothetical protein